MSENMKNEQAGSDRITSRFGRESTAAEVAEGLDLAGKSAIVTGGSSGLGLETARILAAKGSAVHLGVRDLAAGAAAARKINDAIGAERVTFGRIDLSDLASVRDFAKQWGDAPLSLLINNAGVMACPLQQTKDGFEYQFGTNHLGHFLLATLLVPALKKGAPSRLVSLASSGHQASAIDFDDIHFARRDYQPFVAYGQSKTANALFAVEFDRRYKSDGIRAFSVMPGVIFTNLGRHMSDETKAQMGYTSEAAEAAPDFFKTIPQGASTTIWAATAPELEGAGGLYLENCSQARPHGPDTPRGTGVMKHALDPDDARRLWTESETMVAAALAGETVR
ncbi:SDR family NAD(P)-dependent oxidoreductase [Sphingopyxis sp.]|uniref:SDR family NAD(P)-dependent oxidoreductase n=1 Tax=Sphingopyxis sp. TaxID=1908224 RepID=UPI003BA94F5F